jgi:Ferritin-like domain
MDRRRFLATSAGVSATVLGGPWLATANAATEDDLAFANLGVSAELLLKDFYGKALAGKRFTAPRAKVLRQGQAAATRHAQALSNLLVTAGDSAPVEQDFEFVWPRRTFSDASSTVRTGLVVLRALLGSYQTAAASASTSEYRMLFASLGASVAQQIGALSGVSAPVPAATDVETASAVLERYLG